MLRHRQTEVMKAASLNCQRVRPPSVREGPIVSLTDLSSTRCVRGKTWTEAYLGP